MEALLEETTKAVARKEVKLDYLEKRTRHLEEEERRKRFVPLPPSSYHYVENHVTNANPYYSAPRQSLPLPYPPSGCPDLSNEYKIEQENSREKKEIRKMYEGDIAD
jgi:hypothetical protein